MGEGSRIEETMHTTVPAAFLVSKQYCIAMLGSVFEYLAESYSPLRGLKHLVSGSKWFVLADAQMLGAGRAS